MIEAEFSTQQVLSLTGLTRRQLSYWRKSALVIPSQRTQGGHWRYTFIDLIALRTAKKLIDAGVSVQRIRKSLSSLTSFLPHCRAPLTEMSLVATGDMILVLHGDSAFEALTGQEWIMPVAELAQAAAQCHKAEPPRQGQLFGIAPATIRYQEGNAA